MPLIALRQLLDMCEHISEFGTYQFRKSFAIWKMAYRDELRAAGLYDDDDKLVRY